MITGIIFLKEKEKEKENRQYYKDENRSTMITFTAQ